jgi:hypothetical protein
VDSPPITNSFLVPRVAALVSVLALLVGCAASDGRLHDLDGSQVASLLASDVTTTTLVPVQPTVVTVFLTAPAYRPSDPPTLVPVARVVEAPGSLDKVLAVLVAGPNKDEVRQGFRSSVRPSAKLMLTGVTDGTATVDIPLDFAGSLVTEQIAALAQIVYSATALTSVTAVRFTSNGRAIPVSIGDGSQVAVPVTRITYAALAPRTN